MNELDWTDQEKIALTTGKLTEFIPKKKIVSSARAERSKAHVLSEEAPSVSNTELLSCPSVGGYPLPGPKRLLMFSSSKQPQSVIKLGLRIRLCQNRRFRRRRYSVVSEKRGQVDI